MTISEGESKKVFNIDKNNRPCEYVKNDFKDQGDVIIDRATGLMWQKSGSIESLTYKSAKDYVAKLNQNQFATYDDWRLPTIPELISLIEPKKKANALGTGMK